MGVKCLEVVLAELLVGTLAICCGTVGGRVLVGRGLGLVGFSGWVVSGLAFGGCWGGRGASPIGFGGGSVSAGGGGSVAKSESGRFHGAVGNGVGVAVARY